MLSRNASYGSHALMPRWAGYTRRKICSTRCRRTISSANTPHSTLPQRQISGSKQSSTRKPFLSSNWLCPTRNAKATAHVSLTYSANYTNSTANLPTPTMLTKSARGSIRLCRWILMHASAWHSCLPTRRSRFANSKTWRRTTSTTSNLTSSTALSATSILHSTTPRKHSRTTNWLSRRARRTAWTRLPCSSKPVTSITHSATTPRLRHATPRLSLSFPPNPKVTSEREHSPKFLTN